MNLRLKFSYTFFSPDIILIDGWYFVIIFIYRICYNKLENIIAENHEKPILILVDVFGSVAYIEAKVALEKYRVDEENALIICGLSIPMAVKLHNVKELVSIPYIRSAYERHNRLGYDLPIRNIRKTA